MPSRAAKSSQLVKLMPVKTPVPNVGGTVARLSRYFMSEQPLKASLPMLAMVAGSSTCVRPVQPLKASACTATTLKS